jgi:PTH1 family peptidyl-tRNA hydrolase
LSEEARSYQRLVVGLGNPGFRYRRTRHNAGFWVLEELGARHGLHFAPKGRALVAEFDGARLAMPLTFMNESGTAVRDLVRHWPEELPEGLVVVHDELDLPPGTVRVKVGGGLAGHNGLRSIAQALGTREFVRVRIGIGRPSGREEVVSWVLARPSRAEEPLLEEAILRAADAVEALLVTSTARVMNQVNTRGAARGLP